MSEDAFRYDPRQSVLSAAFRGIKDAGGPPLNHTILQKWADRFVVGNESKGTEDMENLIVAMLLELWGLK